MFHKIQFFLPETKTKLDKLVAMAEEEEKKAEEKRKLILEEKKRVEEARKKILGGKGGVVSHDVTKNPNIEGETIETKVEEEVEDVEEEHEDNEEESSLLASNFFVCAPIFLKF